MPEDEKEVIIKIREQLARIETKLDQMQSVGAVAEAAKETAITALQSAKSAHYRLDKIDKIITWTSTTILGALIVAVVTFIVKGGLSK